VRRHLLDIVILIVFATIVVAYVAAAQPAVRNVALHAYVFVVGGLLMLGIVAAAGDAVPRRRRSALDQVLGESVHKDRRVSELERMEREVTLATTSAHDLHYRLLPQLREIARCRLERTGREPSRETLGGWWELLRPDRPPPDDRFARGISRTDLVALVADLEAMG
jgi:hypothetical protein